MIKKACLGLAILIIFTAVLSGCGQVTGQSGSNTPSNTQWQVQNSVTQTITGSTGSTAAVSDNATTSVPKSEVGSTSGSTDSEKSNSAAGATANNPVEKPVAPEKNPPGDIPDTQVFVKYTSSKGGYELQTPEGWARTENGADVKFVDKFDGLQVNVINTKDAFTLDSISKNQVVNLTNTARAVKVKSVKAVKLAGQQAYVVSYDSNSEPDSVTNKQIRLENQNFYYYKNGNIAVVKVWAPFGADNVDQWNYISQNFKWR